MCFQICAFSKYGLPEFTGGDMRCMCSDMFGRYLSPMGGSRRGGGGNRGSGPPVELPDY